MQISNPYEALFRQNDEILSRLKKLEGMVGDKPTPKLPRFLSIDEVMKLTGWSRPTVYGKTHRRQLPVVKAGKKLMFPADELLAHLESLKRPIITTEQ